MTETVKAIINQLATDFALEKHGDKKFTNDAQTEFEADVKLYSQKLASAYGIMCHDALLLSDRMGLIMQNQVEAIERQLAEIQRGISYCTRAHFDTPIVFFSGPIPATLPLQGSVIRRHTFKQKNVRTP